MVTYILESYPITQNRACRLINISRSVFTYEAQVPCDDELIAKELTVLAERHKRYGFGKIFSKIRKAGFVWNHKRVYRVYCSLKLNLKIKPKKRLPAREKIRLAQPKQINESWSLDYMSDALINGKKFRTANVIDDHNREVLGIKACTSLPAQRVVEFLDDIVVSRGRPKQLRVDNGPENIAKIMRNWANQHGIDLKFIQPGKPAQNAYIERFNRTYREEVLNMYLFKNIEEVQLITDQWVSEYNNDRPHYSLGNLTPKEYITQNKILF